MAILTMGILTMAILTMAILTTVRLRELKEASSTLYLPRSPHISPASPCISRLRELKEAEDDAGMRSVSQMQLSLAEVERTWWDALPETDKEHQARVQEILAQVQYSPHDSIIPDPHPHPHPNLHPHPHPHPHPQSDRF